MANLKYFSLRGLWRFDDDELEPIEDIDWPFLPDELKPGYYLHTYLDDKALVIDEECYAYLTKKSLVKEILGKHYDIENRPSYPGRKMYDIYVGGYYYMTPENKALFDYWRDKEVKGPSERLNIRLWRYSILKE